MPRERSSSTAVFSELPAMRSGPWHTLTAAGRVTVLLFFLASRTSLYGAEGNGIRWRVFQFRYEFRMPPAPGRVDGLMASDGRRQRIAIYWMEPPMFRESPSFLRCCDLVFDHDVVHYWIQGMPQPGRFHLCHGEKAPLLPVQKSPESILQSVLAIVSQIRRPRETTDTPLEIAAFFGSSRGQTQYQYQALPAEAGPRPASRDAVSGAQVLNTLPHGREYSKETRDDGSVVWRAGKAMNGPPIATVTVQRVDEPARDVVRGTFDEQTLGQWALVPEAYRAYWSFERAIGTVRISSDVRTFAQNLYCRLDSYLDQNKTPPEVGRALDRLRFQAALLTADSNCVWRAAQAAVTGLCADATVPRGRCLIDLATMSGQIQTQCPERMEEQLRPLVAQVVHHAGQDAGAGMNRLMADITNNGWFAYGELLVSEMRRAGLIEERDVDAWTAKLHASRLARGGAASDPCDATASVQRYLAQLDTDPPKGALDMNDIRGILDEGLTKRYTAGQSETKRKVVENVIRSLRLIAGQGPFCGDPEKLIPALERFACNYLQMYKTAGSFDTTLATFLALSFCDTSTVEDHERLSRQFQSCFRALQSHVNDMLAARGLTALVTPEDVERRFQVYERRFQQYTADPLWPTFKFPWTRDEEARLDGALRLRLAQLEPVFDEMSLKVKYGGASEELKDNTAGAISIAARELLARAASLRLPPYPGVGCQYLGGYGFAAVIRSALYQEGSRPRERFQAMKHFHLGHRLQSVVEREEKWTLQAEQKEMSK